jgi:hypothetical protein
MYSQLFQFTFILFYFGYNILLLLTSIYFLNHSDCSQEKNLSIWLLISTILDFCFGIFIIVAKKYFPRFKFPFIIPKPEDESTLELGLLHSTSYSKVEKIIMIIFGFIYPFILGWAIFGTVMFQKSWCEVPLLYDVIIFQIICNFIYALLSSIVIFVNMISKV